jgi:hypothetical protein
VADVLALPPPPLCRWYYPGNKGDISVCEEPCYVHVGGGGLQRVPRRQLPPGAAMSCRRAAVAGRLCPALLVIATDEAIALWPM